MLEYLQCTRKINKQETFQVYELILRLAALFYFRCAVCHKKCTTGKYFTIHHIKYVPGEKTHKDFSNRLDYYKYLFPIVAANPKRFALVCNKDHGVVTKLARYKKAIRKRLFKLSNQSAKD